jgi:glycosyltransferase involved in cell wall biosynthesis
MHSNVGSVKQMIPIDKPLISILISSRNRSGALRKCLQAIDTTEMQECHGELILVDNNSVDDTWSVMQSMRSSADFPVTVIRQKWSSLVDAKNSGVAATRADLVVFTDDDCYLSRNYLRNAIEVFRNETFDYCSGQVLLYDPLDSFYGCNTSERFKLYPPYGFLEATNELQGNNLIIRRRVLEQVGNFDRLFGPDTKYRCEDIDYCARASWAGFTGAFVPTLAVYHHHGRRDGSPEIVRLKGANDFSRGAYYAKCLWTGKYKYIPGWLRCARYHHLGVTFREVLGAMHYTMNAAGRFFTFGGSTGNLGAQHAR